MPTDLALALDFRIRHLLVDEFQDTSLNQAELLIRLTAGWQSGDGRTLFLVGDPMQSIYRFRQAEVGLFLDIWEKGFFGQIRMITIQLSVNFRSQSGIVDWVNQYFPEIFPRFSDAAAGEVAFAYAKAFHAASDNNAVTVYPFLQKNDLAEADQIVAIVRETQAIQPGGKIAILVRNRAHLASIVIRLRQAGLRFQALEIEKLAQRPVIQDLTALTRALLHPGDRIAWLALLRAPFCGLSLHDLHCIAGRDSGQAVIDLLHSNCSLVGLSKDGQQRLERILPILDCTLSLRDKISLRSNVEGVWIQLGGPASVANETDLADAEVYFQLLEKFDQTGCRLDVQELEEALAQLFALPDITADDTLQIMTLHKAKGLEFDTVILPGLGKSARRDQEKLLNWMECRTQAGSTDLICAPISAQGSDRNPISAYVLSIDRRKALGEDARLLYVAVTRAKHRLHLLGHLSIKAETVKNSTITPAADTLLAKLWPAVANHFQARLRNEAALDRDQAEHYHSAERYTGRMRLAADWSPPDIPEGAEFPSAPASNLITESVDFDWAGDTARLVGLVVHRLLQHIGLIGIENLCESDLVRYEQSGKLLLKQLGVAPQFLELAIRQISVALKIMCVDDAVGRWILSSTHQDAHCEWALSTSIGESETSLNIIDRTFIDATGTRWIIDYKTGIHEGGAIDEFLYREQQRYRPQLERYAAILQKMENRRIRLGIYFPLLGEWREWLYQTA